MDHRRDSFCHDTTVPGKRHFRLYRLFRYTGAERNDLVSNAGAIPGGAYDRTTSDPSTLLCEVIACSRAPKQKSRPDFRLNGLVDRTGFEPVTPSMSRKYSNQL